MTAILSPSKFGIYVCRPRERRQILSKLKAAKKKIAEREKERKAGKGKKSDGGDYYVQLTSKISQLEKSGKISELADKLGEIDDHPTDKRKKPFLIQCGKGYLSIRAQYDVKGVSFPRKTYRDFKNFRARRSADVIWEISERDYIYVCFYLDKTDEQRLTQSKADVMAALMAQEHEYDDSNMFVPVDLLLGQKFEIRDDGSRLIPTLERACTEIDAALE